MIASALEETRTRERILALGFVPHAALFKYLGNVEKPSNLTIDKLSQARAEEVWPKVKTSLQLTIEDCLGDEKIFRTFDEIIQAHEAGLYQMTAASAFSVIERAARLAQPGPHRKRTSDWLGSGLGDMTFYDVPSQWRRGWIGIWACSMNGRFATVERMIPRTHLPFHIATLLHMGSVRKLAAHSTALIAYCWLTS